MLSAEIHEALVRAYLRTISEIGPTVLWREPRSSTKLYRENECESCLYDGRYGKAAPAQPAQEPVYGQRSGL
jgi:hypothetical protein